MTETELDLLQELLTEKMLRLRKGATSSFRYTLNSRSTLDSILSSMRTHFKKPFEITDEQFTEVVQATNIVLRHIS